MKIGKYDALTKDEVRQVFIDYIDALNMPIIDYFAIGVQDTICKTSELIPISVEIFQSGDFFHYAANPIFSA